MRLYYPVCGLCLLVMILAAPFAARGCVPTDTSVLVLESMRSTSSIIFSGTVVEIEPFTKGRHDNFIGTPTLRFIFEVDKWLHGSEELNNVVVIGMQDSCVTDFNSDIGERWLIFGHPRSHDVFAYMPPTTRLEPNQDAAAMLTEMVEDAMKSHKAR